MKIRYPPLILLKGGKVLPPLVGEGLRVGYFRATIIKRHLQDYIQKKLYVAKKVYNLI